ncbi:hypothetical protein C8Q80DRAFT_1166364 [Daedaleopsis nitida]|nr:hypothetical protein C8Q80DRAFT_1166364 [Daedaleopsis nitida]
MHLATNPSKHLAPTDHHDLESFYWIMLWVMLPHIPYNILRDVLWGVFPVFGDGDTEPKLSALEKYQWPHCKIDRFYMPESRPRHTLMADFGRLAPEGMLQSSRVSPTHDSVGKVFKDALASPGWLDIDGSRYGGLIVDKPTRRTLRWASNHRYLPAPVVFSPNIRSSRSGAMMPSGNTGKSLRRGRATVHGGDDAELSAQDSSCEQLTRRRIAV